MSDLEKFISDNRDDFAEESLPEGHEQRFLLRLEKNQIDKKGRVQFWRVAAAIIVLLVAGGSLLLPRLNSPADVQYGSMALSEVSEEMADIELYYSSELDRQYESLLALSETDAGVKQLFNELDTLNVQYVDLEKQLYKSGKNDRVVLAMIENFRLRLEIVEKLERIKQQTQAN